MIIIITIIICIIKIKKKNGNKILHRMDIIIYKFEYYQNMWIFNLYK